MGVFPCICRIPGVWVPFEPNGETDGVLLQLALLPDHQWHAGTIHKERLLVQVLTISDNLLAGLQIDQRYLQPVAEL